MLFDFLVSDYPILLTVLGLLYVVGSRHASNVREMWNDQTPWARAISRAAGVALGAFLLWATVVDNWRQLLGFLVDEKERWRSDLFLNDPPADALRVMTWLLLGLSVLGTAFLFARYARGYVAPIVVWPVAMIGFFVLNKFRMTFEPGGPLSERGVDFGDPWSTLGSLMWFAMFYAVMATLIALAYAILWAPAAFVVALVYRNTAGRQRYVEPEMYRLMRERRAMAGRDEPRSTSP